MNRPRMPKADESDISSLAWARENAKNLTVQQLKELRHLYKDINVVRFSYWPINKKILPVFYKMGLFTGSSCYWRDGMYWALSRTKHKYDNLDLDLTLILLTASLAGRDDGVGAEFWYRRGVTRRLLKHLIKLVEAERKHDEE